MQQPVSKLKAPGTTVSRIPRTFTSSRNCVKKEYIIQSIDSQLNTEIGTKNPPRSGLPTPKTNIKKNSNQTTTKSQTSETSLYQKDPYLKTVSNGQDFTNKLRNSSKFMNKPHFSVPKPKFSKSSSQSQKFSLNEKSQSNVVQYDKIMKRSSLEGDISFSKTFSMDDLTDSLIDMDEIIEYKNSSKRLSQNSYSSSYEKKENININIDINRNIKSQNSINSASRIIPSKRRRRIDTLGSRETIDRNVPCIESEDRQICGDLISPSNFVSKEKYEEEREKCLKFKKQMESQENEIKRIYSQMDLMKSQLNDEIAALKKSINFHKRALKANTVEIGLWKKKYENLKDVLNNYLVQFGEIPFSDVQLELEISKFNVNRISRSPELMEEEWPEPKHKVGFSPSLSRSKILASPIVDIKEEKLDNDSVEIKNDHGTNNEEKLENGNIEIKNEELKENKKIEESSKCSASTIDFSLKFICIENNESKPELFLDPTSIGRIMEKYGTPNSMEIEDKDNKFKLIKLKFKDTETTKTVYQNLLKEGYIVKLE